MIGFVGLMTPHLLRLVIGADHRRLLPAVVLGGADPPDPGRPVARTRIAPQELPVGAVDRAARRAVLPGWAILPACRERARKASAGA